MSDKHQVAQYKNVTFFCGPSHQKLKMSAADGTGLLLVCLSILFHGMLPLLACNEMVNI
jgi:hypothetical protein